MKPMRTRRTLAAENRALREQVRLLLGNQAQLYAQATELRAENLAQRAVIAGLGRQAHGAQAATVGDTIPMPRVRSLPPVATPVLPFPPKGWGT